MPELGLGSAVAVISPQVLPPSADQHWVIFLFIGTCLFAYYNHESNATLLAEVKTRVAEEQLADEKNTLTDAAYQAKLQEAIGELEHKDIGDKVLPHFIVHKLPPGLAGLLFAAIFAAAMSSIDTSLNSSATVILSDIYKRYIRPDAGEKESMRVLHASTLFWGAVGTGVALAMIGQESLLDAWWKLSGIFTGAMLGLFLLGFLVRRAGAIAALAGVLCGVALIGWMTFSPHSPFHTFCTSVFGSTTIVLVGFLVGLFVTRKPNGGSEV